MLKDAHRLTAYVYFMQRTRKLLSSLAPLLSTLILYIWHLLKTDHTEFISVKIYKPYYSSCQYFTDISSIIHSSYVLFYISNPSSDIHHSVKAFVGLFVFMTGTVNHLLSAFEVHPYDKEAWLSTCLMICHP